MSKPNSPRGHVPVHKGRPLRSRWLTRPWHVYELTGQAGRAGAEMREDSGSAKEKTDSDQVR